MNDAVDKEADLKLDNGLFTRLCRGIPLDNPRFKASLPTRIASIWSHVATHPWSESDMKLPLLARCLRWLSCCASASQRSGQARVEACQNREQSLVICSSWLPSETMPQWQITHTHTLVRLGQHRKHTFTGSQRYPKMAKLINACVKNEAQICVIEALACGRAAVGHVFGAHSCHA